VTGKRWVRDVACRVIAGGLYPDHATIARFRARLETALGGLFSQVLRLLAAEGMVSAGLLSLDGTKLAGNAAQKANRTLPQIEKILAGAAAADAAEDARYGDAAGEPTPRANITDPDVRVMRNQKGYVAGYNGQAVVTADQVIAGAMLSRHPAGRTLLHPLPDTCREQLTEAGIRPRLRTVLADSGYVSEENLARAGQDKLRLLVPLAKDPDRPGSRPADLNPGRAHPKPALNHREDT
jgi:hypothetical protein